VPIGLNYVPSGRSEKVMDILISAVTGIQDSMSDYMSDPSGAVCGLGDIDLLGHGL
jgi:hypothetical protein